VKTVVIGGKIVAKVSIIVPIFNASDYLGRCVESLLKQTMKSLEIILVNDGSTDDSLQICHFYAKDDKRIRVIDKPNGGVSSARNLGLDVARGEYIGFVDPDDWVEATIKVPPIVKTQIQYLSESKMQ